MMHGGFLIKPPYIGFLYFSQKFGQSKAPEISSGAYLVRLSFSKKLFLRSPDQN